MTTSSHYPSMQEVDAQIAAKKRRSAIARMGAAAMHAKYDPKETTRGAFEARMRRYEEEVDPTGELKRRDPQALAKRVEHKLKLEMERVRYAKMKLHDMVRRTPSDDLPMLGAELVALEMNGQAIARINTDAKTLGALKAEQREAAQHAETEENEAAPVSAEAAPSPQISAKHPKYVSSDGGALSVAPTRRRRQTSTPSGSSMATPQKKATKSHGATKHSDSRN